MLIGILNCGRFPQREDAPARDYDTLYADMLDGHGLSFKSWQVVDMAFPNSITDADGWLIGGSKHGVYDDIPFIAPLKAFVRESYDAGVPVAGICFGHQLIAQALGGEVEKFAGGWGMGHMDYDFDGDMMTLNAFHQDQVVGVPPEARVIATNPFCENAALAYKGPAFSLQAHPEFAPRDMDLLYTERAPKIADAATIDAALARKGEANNNADMARRIAQFFKEAAA